MRIREWLQRSDCGGNMDSKHYYISVEVYRESAIFHFTHTLGCCNWAVEVVIEQPRPAIMLLRCRIRIKHVMIFVLCFHSLV